MHEQVNIHIYSILLSLLWDCVHIAVCEKCLVHRGECVTTGGLYRPTHLCVAHLNCTTKKSSQFFLWCGKVGGCLVRGVVVHVSGGRGLHGVSEEGGVI